MIDQAFRADLIVEDELIVEVKSVEQITPLHGKQLLTYLRLTGLRKGLILNFNARLLKTASRASCSNGGAAPCPRARSLCSVHSVPMLRPLRGSPKAFPPCPPCLRVRSLCSVPSIAVYIPLAVCIIV